MLSKQTVKVIVGFNFALLRRTIVTAQVYMTSAPMISSECLTPGMFSVAYITVPDMEVGKKIATGLVKNKLAACVNIIPGVTSIYEWKEEINEDSELLLMVKTRTSKVEELTEFVRSNHPYEVCEVITLPIHKGNPPYLKWIEDTVPEK